MQILLLSVAAASEGFAGLVLPNASPMEAGDGFAGAHAYVHRDPFSWAGGGGIEAVVAPHDRVALSMRALVVPDEWPIVLGLVGARYLAVEGDRFRLAPWVGLGGLVQYEAGNFWDGPEGGGLAVGGLALEAGGPRLRFDLSSPLLGVPLGWLAGPAQKDSGGGEYWPYVALNLFVWVAATELGVTWRAAEHHEVRLGMESVVPTLAWRYLGEHVYLQLTATTRGGDAALGVRF